MCMASAGRNSRKAEVRSSGGESSVAPGTELPFRNGIFFLSFSGQPELLRDGIAVHDGGWQLTDRGSTVARRQLMVNRLAGTEWQFQTGRCAVEVQAYRVLAFSCMCFPFVNKSDQRRGGWEGGGKLSDCPKFSRKAPLAMSLKRFSSDFALSLAGRGEPCRRRGGGACVFLSACT